MGSDNWLYPKTLSALVYNAGDVAWKQVFLFFFASWAAFTLPYIATSPPNHLLQSASSPAALVLASLIGLRLQNRTIGAFVAALLYALITAIPPLVHSPVYGTSPSFVAQEAANTFF